MDIAKLSRINDSADNYLKSVSDELVERLKSEYGVESTVKGKGPITVTTVDKEGEKFNCEFSGDEESTYCKLWITKPWWFKRRIDLNHGMFKKSSPKEVVDSMMSYYKRLFNLSARDKIKLLL